MEHSNKNNPEKLINFEREKLSKKTWESPEIAQWDFDNILNSKVGAKSDGITISS